MFALYRGIICPCTEYFSQVWEGSTHTAALNMVESKAFRRINSRLTDYNQSLKHRHNVNSLSIFYRYFHDYYFFLNLPTACPSPALHFRGLAAVNFLLSLIPALSISPTQELSSLFTISSISLVNCGTLCLIIFSHLLTS